MNIQILSKYIHDNTDGCVVPVETENMQVTDKSQRPVILSIGLLYGSLESMINQVEFAIENVTKDKNMGICVVIEADHKSFRFPDRKIRKTLSHVNRKYNDLISKSIIHFINIPTIIRLGMKFALPFLPEELKKIIVMHKSSKSFRQHFHSNNYLSRWGGEVVFSLDEYICRKCLESDTTPLNCKEKISNEEIYESRSELIKYVK